MGETEVTLGRSLTAEQYREVLASSLEEYQRLSHLIDSLLFLARAETAHLQIHESDFAVHESISAVIGDYLPRAKKEHRALTHNRRVARRRGEALPRRGLSRILSHSLWYAPPRGQ